MNIIRKIKLEQLGYYICQDDTEKKLFEFIKNNLLSLKEVKIGKNSNGIYYFKENEYIMDIHTDSLNVNYELLWKKLEFDFEFNDFKIRELLKLILKQHFKINVNVILINDEYTISQIYKILKNEND